MEIFRKIQHSNYMKIAYFYDKTGKVAAEVVENGVKLSLSESSIVSFANKLNGEIVLVVSNRKSAFGLTRAQNANIKTLSNIFDNVKIIARFNIFPSLFLPLIFFFPSIFFSALYIYIPLYLSIYVYA